MSINNLTTATGILPQFATSAGGQLYMIAPNQYFVNRNWNLDATHAALTSTQQIQHRFIQAQQHQQHQQPQLPPPPPPPPPQQAQVQTPPQSKDQTNAKVRNIKEKCISHYIDGQLIIETSKPLTERKLKSTKKKKLHHNQQQQQQQQQQKQQNNGNSNRQPQQLQTPQLQSQSPSQPTIQPQQIKIQLQHQPRVPALPQPIQQALPQPILPKHQIKQQQHQLQLQHQQHQQIQLQHQHQQQQLQQQHQLQQQQQHHQQQQQQQLQQQIQQAQPSQPKAQPVQKKVQNNQQGGNEVQRTRAEMATWSVAEVVEFIERHEDIRQYSSKFAEDEVDGKALLLMIDRNLNFQILTSMFKHGPAMKIEATLSKYKIND